LLKQEVTKKDFSTKRSQRSQRGGLGFNWKSKTGLKQKMQRALEQEITEVTEREKNSSKGAKHRTRKREHGTVRGEPQAGQ